MKCHAQITKLLGVKMPYTDTFMDIGIRAQHEDITRTNTS